ncbi:hypothetical protein CEXT_154571 [Caerostris extrusa]|uniref:Uncharacterized protein n=1 Tax=Caerostris extrusa TaxID=172846 RepID=A0AAV4M6K3_CAEEX|nr:hypothetical protein CEXT_154571 [Caerostris extrusa]
MNCKELYFNRTVGDIYLLFREKGGRFVSPEELQSANMRLSLVREHRQGGGQLARGEAGAVPFSDGVQRPSSVSFELQLSGMKVASRRVLSKGQNSHQVDLVDTRKP